MALSKGPLSSLVAERKQESALAGRLGFDTNQLLERARKVQQRQRLVVSDKGPQ